MTTLTAAELHFQAVERLTQELAFSPNSEKLKVLIDKWDLSYKCKSICTTGYDRFEQIFGEVPPRIILNLLPESLLDVLLTSDFRMKYSNGEAGNGYDTRTNTTLVKKTHDVLHEIGHALWYILIPDYETAQKQAVIDSLAEDKSHRQRLDIDDIPTMHKMYAKLVGAYSGQFLVENYSYARMNDLEEHFARNFDYLMKGKPLITLPNSKISQSLMLAFYEHLKISDKRFRGFYRRSIIEDYDGRPFLRQPIEQMRDGDPITTVLLKKIKMHQEG